MAGRRVSAAILALQKGDSQTAFDWLRLAALARENSDPKAAAHIDYQLRRLAPYLKGGVVLGEAFTRELISELEEEAWAEG